ncbi:hypothetical protein HYH03_002393 [Edaphochlamys debaryana]|uniref:Uncharacterized protein n=1 Tax=Edaphochlamys debaryana TaxID=47281 RepID=A0A835YEJ4_9CHLO|nr:hypothetical protein HYH03_002393 [Edaphochlamys debaryana]|eukprot:KAG2499446.1 hypothetical protein HYH03_002393 [Edaphochlamys debaryana]
MALLCRRPGVLSIPRRTAACVAATPLLLRPHLPRPRIRLRVTASAAAASFATSPEQPTSQAPSPASTGGLWKAWQKWWTVETPTKANQLDQEQPAKLGPVIKKLWDLCRPDAKLLFVASFFMVIASLCELAIPHFATKAIFAASEGAAYKGFLSILAANVAAYGISAALRGFAFSILNNRMTRRLRTELFTNLSCRETAFFDREDVGNLTSRLQADCQAMTKVIATNANIAVRNLLQAVGGVVYLYLLSPYLCGITVAISAVLWGVTIVYGEFARRMQKIFQDVLAESNVVAEEALTLSRVVRTFGTEPQETKRYTTWLDRLYEVGKRQAAGYSLFVAGGHIACYASKVAALLVGCYMVLQGQLTAEQLTNFIMYVEFVTYASLNVCDEFTEICEAVGASERVVTMLGAPAAPQIAPGATLPAFRGHVTLKDVTFSYASRPNSVALDGVTIDFEPGKLTALVGLSGSGKTTVCALLQRLYDPTGGAILLDGDLDLRKADAGWYRTQIGVVPQEPRLFSRSVADNIAYGMEHAPPDRAAIEEAARAANAHDFISAMPQGYDTLVTDKLLSGGQKQRLALARALIRKPKLLVLDEFSSALDAESEAQVNAALDRAMAARDRTVVVIAHRLSTVRHADCIVVMDKGQVYEMGSHHELLSRRGIYWQLVCRQQYGIDPNTAGASDTDSEAIMAAAAAAAAKAAGIIGPVPTAGATSTNGNGTSLAAAATAPRPSGSATASVTSSKDSLDGGANGRSSSTSGGGGGASSGGAAHGSTASMEDEFMGGGMLGSATDDQAGPNDRGNGNGYRNGNGNGNADGGGAGYVGVAQGVVVPLGLSMASMGSSLATFDDDVDEATRPAAAGAGRPAAVLAAVVVTEAELRVLREEAEAGASFSDGEAGPAPAEYFEGEPEPASKPQH